MTFVETIEAIKALTLVITANSTKSSIENDILITKINDKILELMYKLF